MSPADISKACAFGYQVSMQLAHADADEAHKIFYALRKDRRLHTAVQQMNQLLEEPSFESLVQTAFRRIGLEHGG